MESTPRVVVFADVDQAFLASQSSTAPFEAEEILAREHVALVLCSNMTRTELEACQQELQIKHPFICENGAAVLVPEGYFPFEVPCDRELTGYHAIEFGKPYHEVVAMLHRTATRLDIPVIGFSDLSIERVARECGLSLARARLAKLREYDEPFRLVNFTPEARERLWRGLRGFRLGCTYRSSFEHVGTAVNKRMGVGVLSSLYRRAFGRLVTVGLGSSENRAALFPSVPLPFVAETASAGPNPESTRGIPLGRFAIDRGAWIESILELVHRARERRPSQASAAG
jgi:mannosyl-3-phosphoglycerate phosphatase